jgi:6,7-dimethyl-8-ribityllumazine synthase
MPEPTVTVRMKEIATLSLGARQPAPVASSRALILATALEEETMNQIPAVPRSDATSRPARTMRIAVVSSSWHRDIVDSALQAMQTEFARSPEPPDRIDSFDVPGAFEIPLHAKKLAATGRYDAIVACGLVVNGGIYRHDFVAAAVIDALMRVQIESGVPVLSAVLTPRDFHEHDDHRQFFREHFVKKGCEVARACLDTIANQRALAALPVE